MHRWTNNTGAEQCFIVSKGFFSCIFKVGVTSAFTNHLLQNKATYSNTFVNKLYVFNLFICTIKYIYIHRTSLQITIMQPACLHSPLTDAVRLNS